MLVCWKGGPSPIHNHADSDCLMCVVRGVIRETKYYAPKNEYNLKEFYLQEITDLQEDEAHLIMIKSVYIKWKHSRKINKRLLYIVIFLRISIVLHLI
jgi:hypothetical protein